MWEFADSLLERSGVVAGLLFLAIVTMAGVVGVLWRKTEKLHAQAMAAIATASDNIRGHADATAQLLKTHAEEMRRLSDLRIEELKTVAATHASATQAMAAENAKQVLTLSQRIDELQERRVREAGELTERVMDHIRNIDRFASKLEATIDVLRGGRR
jgi:hypothetical protein